MYSSYVLRKAVESYSLFFHVANIRNLCSLLCILLFGIKRNFHLPLNSSYNVFSLYEN